MRAQLPDQVVVTGDLVNLGWQSEFVAAREWLAGLWHRGDVTIVPGNHDAYVAGSLRELEAEWRDFMSDDRAPDAPVIFPFVRRRGRAAIVGVSSAVATAPLMATGRIEPLQAAALARTLTELGETKLVRIVLIHHPPGPHAAHWHRRLIGAEHFRKAIRESGAELILHGHDHRMTVAALPGPAGPVPVVGAATGSLAPHGTRPGGSYNLFRIVRGPAGLRITLTERGLRRKGVPVETFSEMIIAEPGGQAEIVTHA